jgi:hypothetical protein
VTATTTDGKVKIFGKYTPSSTLNGQGSFTPMDNTVSLPFGPVKVTIASHLPGKLITGTVIVNSNGGSLAFLPDPFTGKGSTIIICTLFHELKLISC